MKKKSVDKLSCYGNMTFICVLCESILQFYEIFTRL